MTDIRVAIELYTFLVLLCSSVEAFLGILHGVPFSPLL